MQQCQRVTQCSSLLEPIMNPLGSTAHRHKRVLLVDDHALFRCGMALLVMNNPLVQEVLEAETLTSALAFSGTSVHLVLLDHFMPGVTGISGLKAIRKAFPDATLAIVSGSTTAEDIALAKDYGADGFIAKTTQSTEIHKALSALLRGQRWFPDEEKENTSHLRAARPGFTAKQMEVLAHLSEGLSNRAIAKRMDISENTVRTHVSAILFALGVNSRAQANVAARRAGLIQ